jgi:hypothetical protein
MQGQGKNRRVDRGEAGRYVAQLEAIEAEDASDAAGN